MSNATIIFLLTICIVILVCIIVYQQFVFHNGTKAKIHEISSKLKELLDTGSDEKVTVFTDNRALIELATQINRMLEDRQKVKVEYRRTEMASKKMLSNISHDIKTPMTVILGYLEIMRLNGTQSNEMLQKIESTARRVMGLITQFFTLAKLEAGDIDMPLERLNANEACRENILDFYELLSQKDFQVELDIPDQALYANANKDALQRIMFNLISNAIRYGGDGKYLGIAKFCVLTFYLFMEMVVFLVVFVIAGAVATQTMGITETLPILYLLKWCLGLFLTMLPCIAAMWAITVLFEKPLLSVGLNLLFVIPGVLVANTPLWIVYPYCYSGYLVSCSLHDFTAETSDAAFSMFPFLPCAIVVFGLFFALAVTQFGKKEMR